MFELKPSEIVCLDVETFYGTGYTLRSQTMNMSEYVRHEKFKIHSVAVKDGARKKTRAYKGTDAGKVLQDIDWSQRDLLCHHTHFDGLILSHHFGITPRRYLCTMSMARGLRISEDGAGLDAVAQALGQGHKIPDVLSEARDLRDLPPDLLKRMLAYNIQDTDLTWDIFWVMVKDFNFPAMELALIDITVRCFCDPVLRLDIPRAEAELKRVQELKRQMIIHCGVLSKADIRKLGDAAYEAACTLLNSDAKFAEQLRKLKVDPPVKYSDKQEKEVFAFAKKDVQFLALQEHPKKAVRQVVEARLEAKSSTNENRLLRLLEAGKNGLAIPMYYGYSAAHTHRWGGGNKMNPQNFTRGGEARKSLIAPKGHKVVVADSGQIEARVNLWLAQQLDMLELFATPGKDIYCDFASHDIYKREITPADPVERHIGKTAILGLGYQMGAPKFQHSLQTSMLPVELPLTMCQQVVQAYRRRFNKVQRQWYAFEDVLTQMMLRRAGEYGPRGVLQFEGDRHGGYVSLPNGMEMRYPSLKADMDERRERFTNMQYWSEKDRDWTYIYGGKMTENMVQALARIIVAEQMVAIAERYRVVMMTHDEIVCVAPTRQAQKCLDFMLEQMTVAPAWCDDLPLKAAGGFDDCYSK